MSGRARWLRGAAIILALLTVLVDGGQAASR